MFFAWDITIPANRLETNPVVQTLKLTEGIITHIEVKFPCGCNGLAKVRLFCAEFQLFPLSRGEWVTGDDEAVRGDYYFPLKRAPGALKFHGCSPGSTYPHVVTVRITILPESVASWSPLIEIFTKIAKRMGV